MTLGDDKMRWYCAVWTLPHVHRRCQPGPARLTAARALTAWPGRRHWTSYPIGSRS